MDSNSSPPTPIPAAKSGPSDSVHSASEEKSPPLFHTMSAIKIIISHNPNSNRAIHVSRLHPSIQKPLDDVLRNFSSDEQCWITQLHTLNDIDAPEKDDARIRICHKGYELANEVYWEVMRSRYQLGGELESLTKSKYGVNMKGVTIECFYIPPFYVGDEKLNGGLKERYLVGDGLDELSVDIVNVRMVIDKTPAQVEKNEKNVALTTKAKADEIIKAVEEIVEDSEVLLDWFKPPLVKRVEKSTSSSKTCPEASTSTHKLPVANKKGHRRCVSCKDVATLLVKARMARTEALKKADEKNSRTANKEPETITFSVEKRLQIRGQKRIEEAKKEARKRRQEEEEERRQVEKIKKAVLRSPPRAYDIDTKRNATPISAVPTKVTPKRNIMHAKHPEFLPKVEKRVSDAKLPAAKEEPKPRPSSKIPRQTPSSSSSKLSAVRPMNFKASIAVNLLTSKAFPPQVSKVEVDTTNKADTALIKIHLKEQAQKLEESLHNPQTNESPSSVDTEVGSSSKECPTAQKRYSAWVKGQIEVVGERDQVSLAGRQNITILPQSFSLDVGREVSTVSISKRYMAPSYQTASFAVEQPKIHEPHDKVGLSIPKAATMSSGSPNNRDDQFPLETTQEQPVSEEDWDLVEYLEKDDRMIYRLPRIATEGKVAANDEFEIVNHLYKYNYEPQELTSEEFEGYLSGALDLTNLEGDDFDADDLDRNGFDKDDFDWKVKSSLEKSAGKVKRFWPF